MVLRMFILKWIFSNNIINKKKYSGNVITYKTIKNE
jgi:hypothetical protein